MKQERYTKAAVCRCFSKYVFLYFFDIHKKKPMLESLFNKVAGLRTCNFIKKRLQHRCFPVKLQNFYCKIEQPLYPRACRVGGWGGGVTAPTFFKSVGVLTKCVGKIC